VKGVLVSDEFIFDDGQTFYVPAAWVRRRLQLASIAEIETAVEAGDVTREFADRLRGHFVSGGVLLKLVPLVPGQDAMIDGELDLWRRRQLEDRLVRELERGMRRKLAANRHKVSWDQLDPWICIQRAQDELEELRRVLTQSETGEATVEDVLLEAADVANFVGMVADIVRRRFEG